MAQGFALWLWQAHIEFEFSMDPGRMLSGIYPVRRINSSSTLDCICEMIESD